MAQKVEKCSDCKGSGVKSKESCPSCHGRGKVVIIKKGKK